MHGLRARLGDMKTQEWVAQRASDKMFRDMLEAECNIANMKAERTELNAQISRQENRSPGVSP